MCNQERRQVIWCSYLRIAVLVNNLSSDSLSVVIPLHQIRQFYAVRVFIDHLVHTVPEIQCLTLPAPRAAVRLIIQTGDWRQAAFRCTQDLACGILLRSPCQHISAVISTITSYIPRLCEQGHDLFQRKTNDILRELHGRAVAVAEGAKVTSEAAKLMWNDIFEDLWTEDDSGQ